jgi:hypothetical protein
VASPVAQLVARGAQSEVKDAEYLATPLLWAIHGFGPRGPREKSDQVGAAMSLLEAGANVRSVNREGLSPLDLAGSFRSKDMHTLLLNYFR